MLEAPVPPGAPAYQPDELDYFALDACILNYAHYAGEAYDDGDYEVSYASPSPRAWLEGARTITCFAHHPDGETLLGPLKFSR